MNYRELQKQKYMYSFFKELKGSEKLLEDLKKKTTRQLNKLLKDCSKDMSYLSGENSETRDGDELFDNYLEDNDLLLATLFLADRDYYKQYESKLKEFEKFGLLGTYTLLANMFKMLSYENFRKESGLKLEDYFDDDYLKACYCAPMFLTYLFALGSADDAKKALRLSNKLNDNDRSTFFEMLDGELELDKLLKFLESLRENDFDNYYAGLKKNNANDMAKQYLEYYKDERLNRLQYSTEQKEKLLQLFNETNKKCEKALQKSTNNRNSGEDE